MSIEQAFLLGYSSLVMLAAVAFWSWVGWTWIRFEWKQLRGRADTCTS